MSMWAQNTPKLRAFQVNKSPRAPVVQGAGPFPPQLPSCRASRKEAVLGIFRVPSEMHPSAPRSPLGRLSLSEPPLGLLGCLVASRVHPWDSPSRRSEEGRDEDLGSRPLQRVHTLERLSTSASSYIHGVWTDSSP